MTRASITKRTVDAAKPSTKDQFVWDGEIAGFGLKVTPSGGKVYIYQYRLARPGAAERTPAKRYTIGKHGNLTPDQARKRAKELAYLVEQGIDPREREQEALAIKDAAERRAQEQARVEGQLAFDKVAALWLDHYENEKGRRPSSVRQAKLVVNRYLVPALGSRPMPYIGRADIQPIIDAVPVSKKGTRRAIFAYASVLFGWVVKRGDIESNPLSAMAKPEAPKSRDRVLTDDELADVWRATQALGMPFGPFFRLLILSGQRRSEVAEMKWSELDRAAATWTIPADRAKNDVAHIVPLSAAAIEELDNATKFQNWPVTGYVLTTTGRTPISGITKAKKTLDFAIAKARGPKAKEFPAWRIHDLRRTLATGFQRIGIRFEVTEATLNHVSGAKGGIAGIYQRHDWKEEKRSALDAWSRHIASIIDPAQKGNVVTFGASKKAAAT